MTETEAAAREALDEAVLMHYRTPYKKRPAHMCGTTPDQCPSYNQAVNAYRTAILGGPLVAQLTKALRAALKDQPRVDREGDAYCGGCQVFALSDGIIPHRNGCWVYDAHDLLAAADARQKVVSDQSALVEAVRREREKLRTWHAHLQEILDGLAAADAQKSDARKAEA